MRNGIEIALNRLETDNGYNCFSKLLNMQFQANNDIKIADQDRTSVCFYVCTCICVCCAALLH